ncbi:MAG: nucleoside triphosphate pyrophosphatase [Clostridia bacterium]|nr:nucleoside triphosphate pyrophosphatase [Clostridia bacterium]MDN5323734.1 nucleoside triphosphate pyrophosphatase [Clostridia bacterium]
MKIILASASPRRYELLKQIKIPFTVQVSKINENKIKMGKPQNWVQNLALEKALDVAQSIDEGLVIGADTVVVKENRVLGKPLTSEEAMSMLNFLSGSTHQVMTGIAIVNAVNQRIFTDVEITTVKFRNLTEQEIYSYVASGEPMDKAGAYGIQGLGALLVEGITGCYFNVVGLPLNKLALGLKKFGMEVLNDFAEV